MKDLNDIWKDLIRISDEETRKSHDIFSTIRVPSEYIRFLIYDEDDELAEDEKVALKNYKRLVLNLYKARGLDVYFTFNRDNNKFFRSLTPFGWSERAMAVYIALKNKSKEQ